MDNTAREIVGACARWSVGYARPEFGGWSEAARARVRAVMRAVAGDNVAGYGDDDEMTDERDAGWTERARARG